MCVKKQLNTNACLFYKNVFKAAANTAFFKISVNENPCSFMLAHCNGVYQNVCAKPLVHAVLVAENLPIVELVILVQSERFKYF